MSSGATHFKVSVVLDCVGIPIAFATLPYDLAIASTVGLVVGTIATPDCRDIERATYPSYILSRVPLVGPVLSYSLRLFWYPLALALPHRSKFSHRAGLGTLVAILYTTLICCVLTSLILGLDTLYLILAQTWETRDFSAFLVFSLGWLLQDLSHLVFDL